MPEKNALEELAERLTPKEVLNIEGKAVARDIDFDALVSVQRIVAELAKLQFDANGKPNMYDAFHCVIKCRAIAEE